VKGEGGRERETASNESGVTQLEEIQEVSGISGSTNSSSSRGSSNSGNSIRDERYGEKARKDIANQKPKNTTSN